MLIAYLILIGIFAVICLLIGIYTYCHDDFKSGINDYFILAIVSVCIMVLLLFTSKFNTQIQGKYEAELENLQTEGYTFLVDGNEISSFDNLDDILSKYDYVISSTDKKIILKEK